MRLRFANAWAGRKRRLPRCPACDGARLRSSRRRYEGIWAALFKVRPVKCLGCGIYFPMVADASISTSRTDPIDLHLPFRPLEMDGPPEGRQESESGDEVDFGGPIGLVDFRGVCPICDSKVVRPSRDLSDQPLVARLDLRAPYRCAECNASFDRILPSRVAAAALILLVVLGGLSYLANSMFGRRALPDRSPTLSPAQVPKLPPPVFR